MLLVTFIGILWALSSNVVFVVDGSSFTIPGYMVWCAIPYAFIGSFLTWRVGQPLIPLNTPRYARAAESAFALLRVRQRAESIARFGGGRDARRTPAVHLDRAIPSIRH